MDTRNKIVSSGTDMDTTGAVIVSGCFDPMTAEHAERLTELKGSAARLIVLIADPEDPILPNRARAELLAGLSCVDQVVEDWSATSNGLVPQHDLTGEDTERRQQLIAHVDARQAAG